MLGFKRDSEIAILCSFLASWMPRFPPPLHSCPDAFLCLNVKCTGQTTSLFVISSCVWHSNQQFQKLFLVYSLLHFFLET